MSDRPLKPFLKWAGGKRWLFESAQFSLPKFTGAYFEPFLGGAAVFFETRPDRAILSDANGRLIELYVAVRDKPRELECLMRKHAGAHSKDYYYAVREENFSDALDRAAQFLYLNRTCWNGLYRENLRGQFNVPIGTKQIVVSSADDFPAWSEALGSATLVHSDFEKTIDAATDGDFIFADPPYTVRHNMNGFVKYNQNIFAWKDQVRLRDALKRAAERGASFAITNADHESIRELYKDFGHHSQLGRHSVIAASSVHRAPSTELLITG
ncbi:DNA adenine methylase [Devosia sp. Root635]|uniref:DNA adenine methylase n=1 Tax=Devosia sp. Root635 TaxID=1736575 RepID=UPI0006FFE0EE|nr:Dam family site-specific DNA-(adenine-N6)-methyltransferase [Devosia sp. Root635]KRA47182.1 DNA methyltransferase [Devosia sp. Root635]